LALSEILSFIGDGSRASIVYKINPQSAARDCGWVKIMSIQFSRELIKGRIAEVIFEQMIREEGKYTVIPFGYEHTVPTLAQYREHIDLKRVLENISDAPDFALVSEDKTKLYLVEVKYRKSLDMNDLQQKAAELLQRWNPSWIFVATPSGFYCSPSNTIVANGVIKELSESWVVRERQNDYLQLLNEFER